MSFPKSYRNSGVNLDEAEKTVEKISNSVKSTFNQSVLTEIGNFAALFSLSSYQYKEPILVSSTDGVGTKILLHIKAKTFQFAGIDLVAMSSNDILTLGARPLFFLDYIACGKLNSEMAALMVKGMAKACRKIGAALIGGETAEMPGMYKEKHYDLSGFMVGIVEKSKIPLSKNIKKGDIIIGISSSGPHSNGFSLIRKILKEKKYSLQDKPPSLNKTLKELLLKPTELYHPYVLPLFEKNLVKTAANITGGSFKENIPRVLPKNHLAVINKNSFPVPEIFKFLQREGGIEESEMFSVFNMGIGFVLITGKNHVQEILSYLNKPGEKAYIIGEIKRGDRKVVFK